ncbi:hypothetical protein SNEBB_011354 [Seison nebaliae]|nr:hypothetical protein SNEBB_011354 [Seison nebaliae]
MTRQWTCHDFTSLSHVTLEDEFRTIISNPFQQSLDSSRPLRYRRQFMSYTPELHPPYNELLRIDEDDANFPFYRNRNFRTKYVIMDEVPGQSIFGIGVVPELERFMRIIFGFISPIVIIISLVFNVFNMIVLTRPKMSSPTNALLSGIACFDTGMALSSLPVLLKLYTYSRFDKVLLPWNFCYAYAVLYGFLPQAFHISSIYASSVMAFQRFIFIVFPNSKCAKFMGIKITTQKLKRIPNSNDKGNQSKSSMSCCIPLSRNNKMHRRAMNHIYILLLCCFVVGCIIASTYLFQTGKLNKIVCFSNETDFSFIKSEGIIYNVNNYNSTNFFKTQPYILSKNGISNSHLTLIDTKTFERKKLLTYLSCKYNPLIHSSSIGSLFLAKMVLSQFLPMIFLLIFNSILIKHLNKAEQRKVRLYNASTISRRLPNNAESHPSNDLDSIDLKPIKDTHLESVESELISHRNGSVIITSTSIDKQLSKKFEKNKILDNLKTRKISFKKKKFNTHIQYPTQRGRHSVSKAQNNSRNTTLMLVVVLTTILIVEIPIGLWFFLSFINHTFRLDLFTVKSENIFAALSNSYLIISYPLNFIIYCRMSKMFRRTFHELLGDMKKRILLMFSFL